MITFVFPALWGQCENGTRGGFFPGELVLCQAYDNYTKFCVRGKRDFGYDIQDGAKTVEALPDVFRQVVEVFNVQVQGVLVVGSG